MKILTFLQASFFMAANALRDTKTSQVQSPLLFHPNPTQTSTLFTEPLGSETSHVRVLAENHKNSYEISSYIETITLDKPNIIHLEQYTSGQHLPCSTASMQENPDRICTGWDDEKAYSNTKNFLFNNKMLDAKKIQILKELKIAVDTYGDLIKNGKIFPSDLKPSVKNYIRKLKKEKDPKFENSIEALNYLLSELNAGVPLDQIYKNYYEKTFPNYTLTGHKVMDFQYQQTKREESLLKDISAACKDETKLHVFVAGADHVDKLLKKNVLQKTCASVYFDRDAAKILKKQKKEL